MYKDLKLQRVNNCEQWLVKGTQYKVYTRFHCHLMLASLPVAPHTTCVACNSLCVACSSAHLHP